MYEPWQELPCNAEWTCTPGLYNPLSMIFQYRDHNCIFCAMQSVYQENPITDKIINILIIVSKVKMS